MVNKEGVILGTARVSSQNKIQLLHTVKVLIGVGAGDFVQFRQLENNAIIVEKATA
jgi:hypothetical protein